MNTLIRYLVSAGSIIAGIAFCFGSTLLTGCDSKPAESPPVSAAPTPKVSMDELKGAAEKGDARAMVDYARALLEDARIKSSATQAVMWAELAAKKGSADAEWLLSELYEAGRGVVRSDEKSLEWAKLAADKGHLEAMYAVGLKFATGRGTTKDKQASVQWFEKAAMKGMRLAQFNLAQRFEHGEGTETNLVSAWVWYQMASRDPGSISDARVASGRVESRMDSAGRRQAEEVLKGLAAKVVP